MRSKFGSVATLALFALIIFARQVTGAPNAQVAFAGNIGPVSPTVNQSTDQAFNFIPSNLDAPSSEQEKQGYKKYVSPERLVSDFSSSNVESIALLTPHLREIWCKTELPIEVLAHAPPLTEVTTSYLHDFDSEGEKKFEIIEYQCNRGIGISGSRSA